MHIEPGRTNIEYRQVGAADGGVDAHTEHTSRQRIRQQLLHDIVDENGSQYLVAFLNADGTLGLLGLDDGKSVSDFWGEGLDDYEYEYTVAADRIPALIERLGGGPGDDVLALLRRFHDDPAKHGLHRLLNTPPVEAKFHNWIH
jgi:hypothetical protein